MDSEVQVGTSPWETIHSENIFTSKWLNLRRESIRLPSKRTMDDYFIIEMLEGVVIVAVTTNRELILVRQYKHGLRKVVLELPAGNVERGEKTELAIRRELTEETGFTAGQIAHIGTIAAKPARMSAETFVFFTEDVTPSTTPQENDAEVIQTVLVPLHSLQELIASGAVVTETSLAALLLAWPKLS